MESTDNSAEQRKAPSGAAESNKISRSAFKVSVGGVFSLLAGLGSQAFIAWLFGAGVEMDAFLTAVVVPVYLQAVLVVGLSFVFIPAFIDSKAAGNDEEAWALAGTFFWIVGGVLTAVAIAGSLLAPQIISLTAPGLAPDKAALSAQMLSILMFVVPISGFGSLTVGVQHARDRFFWPAMGGAANSLGNMVALFFLYRSLGPVALAWSYLVAVLAQASITVIPVLRRGWKYRIPLRDERVLNMVKLITPFIVFGVLTKATPVLQRYFASGLPDGDLSYLGYADKVVRIFDALLTSSVATAIFPAMSSAFSNRGRDGLVDTLKYGLRLTAAVSLPLVAIMSAVAIPFTTVLFERGAFTREATLQVSRIVPIVVVGVVVFTMLGNLLARTFYVMKDTRTVPMIAAVSSIIYIFLAAFLVDIWGYVGLATAQTLFKAMGAVVLLLLLFHKLKLFKIRKIITSVTIYAIPSLLAFALAWGLLHILADRPPILQLIVAGGSAGLLYLGVLFQLDKKMARETLELVGLRRLRKFSHFLPMPFRRFVEGKAI